MTEKEKELKALTQCADALSNLEHNSIMKVFQMLSIHFEIVPNVAREFPNSAIEKTNNKGTRFLENNNSESIDENNVELKKNNHKTETNDYPSFKELLVKEYPKNEAEWILCYCFYASNYGSELFTVEQVRENYKDSKRYSVSNRKNFQTNLNKCMSGNWIKHINGDEYIMKEEGVNYAKQILEGKSVSKERKRNKVSKSNI